MLRAFFLATTALMAMSLVQAADEPVVPASLPKEQQENVKKFLVAHSTPERYVPPKAKFVDDPPAQAEVEIKATKEKPIKQYLAQITPHRSVPGAEMVTKADVYYYRPNPEKGKHGITVKHTIDLTTGEQVGETEVMTKAHTPMSREEIAEAVENAKTESPVLKALFAGRDAKAVQYEYLQMKVNRKSETMEPGDRVVTLTFTATPAENEAAPQPVRITVNLTKGTVLPGER